MPNKKPLILITPGDPDGIGPEIFWKAFRTNALPRDCQYLVIGAEKPFKKLRAKYLITEPSSNVEKLIGRPKRHTGNGFRLLGAPKKTPISNLSLNGYQCGWSIERAVNYSFQHRNSAIVTGPIDKKKLIEGGYPYAGHTDFLARLTGRRKKVTMMLVNEFFRISLVTTHIPLKEVSKRITLQKINQTILHTIEALQSKWGIKKPKIALLALNPHAGEEGLLGMEENRKILPAIRKARKEWGETIQIDGPFPSDSFFGTQLMKQKKARYDAIIAMYHDQGLIPVKLLDFQSTVNITLGLPLIRTSVDHGVGMDIVGKGIADPSSFIAAVKLARKLVKQKKMRT